LILHEEVSMRQGVVIAGYFVIAVAFFLTGRLTAPGTPSGTGPLVREAIPASAEPVPAPIAPVAPVKPAPQPMRAPEPARPVAATPPVLPSGSIAIPEGTKPATDPSPSEGPKDAKVIFLEVTDFQCPVCKRAYEPLKTLVADFPPGTVRLVYKQHPLEMHRNALNAATASMAAARQGKFAEYAAILFSNQQALDETSLFRHAQQLSLDMNRFKRDYEDVTLRARARDEGRDAMELGAQGTPSFFVNGHREVGWASYEAVKQMVQQEAAAVDALVAQGKSIREARIARVRQNLQDADKFLKSRLGTEF
jgi:protein-disulfide isomerase